MSAIQARLMRASLIVHVAGGARGQSRVRQPRRAAAVVLARAGAAGGGGVRPVDRAHVQSRAGQRGQHEARRQCGQHR